jgi:hypothetical protein
MVLVYSEVTILSVDNVDNVFVGWTMFLCFVSIYVCCINVFVGWAMFMCVVSMYL